MLNFLPSKQKEELKQEENLKLVLALGIIILAFLASLILVLFAIKISLSTDLEIQEVDFKQREKELENPVTQELEEKIKKYNLILSKLEVFYRDQPDLTPMLEKISQTLPKGIYLTGLNFNSQTFQISLTGFSPTRETLTQFKENLEKIEGLEKIEFSSASWFQATNINFLVNLKIK